jgi:predicted DCC family thiol-disulfide oxidoreductase YuxK
MQKNGFPPFVNKDDRIVLFDGVCKLCNGSVVFLIKHDKHHVFKFASVQSKQGKAILTWFGFPTDYYETMLYVESNKAYTKSDAFLKIISALPRPWCYLIGLKVCPRWLRDWIYDRVALNRYVIFGKYNQCLLPSSDHKGRFIDS